MRKLCIDTVILIIFGFLLAAGTSQAASLYVDNIKGKCNVKVAFIQRATSITSEREWEGTVNAGKWALHDNVYVRIFRCD